LVIKLPVGKCERKSIKQTDKALAPSLYENRPAAYDNLNNNGDNVTTDNIMSFIGQTAIFYLVFNVLVIGIMVYMQSASRAALNWPSVQGKIKNSRIHYRRSYNKADPTPWVKYTYEVAGKSYISKSSDWQNRVDDFPVSQSRQLYCAYQSECPCGRNLGEGR